MCAPRKSSAVLPRLDTMRWCCNQTDIRRVRQVISVEDAKPICSFEPAQTDGLRDEVDGRPGSGAEPRPLIASGRPGDWEQLCCAVKNMEK